MLSCAMIAYDKGAIATILCFLGLDFEGAKAVAEEAVVEAGTEVVEGAEASKEVAVEAAGEVIEAATEVAADIKDAAADE